MPICKGPIAYTHMTSIVTATTQWNNLFGNNRLSVSYTKTSANGIIQARLRSTSSFMICRSPTINQDVLQIASRTAAGSAQLSMVALPGTHQRGYSTSSQVSAEMGDRASLGI